MRNITNWYYQRYIDNKPQFGVPMKCFIVAVLVFALAGCVAPSGLVAPSQATPYGTAKFSPYADIDDIKQLKAVYDFYFPDPNSVPLVLSSIASLMAQTAEFGPHEFEPLKIVVVSHGPELVVFAKRNYTKYKDIVDRAASLAQQGVKFEICRGAAASLNFVTDDFYGFTTVVPSGPYALTYWQMKGYGLIPGGFTNPQRYTNEFNKNDIPLKHNGNHAPAGTDIKSSSGVKFFGDSANANE
jgi:uncharacterized protein